MESSEELSVLSGGFQVKSSNNLAILLERCRESEGIEFLLLVVVGYGFLYILGEICFILSFHFGQAYGHV